MYLYYLYASTIYRISCIKNGTFWLSQLQQFFSRLHRTYILLVKQNQNNAFRVVKITQKYFKMYILYAQYNSCI